MKFYESANGKNEIWEMEKQKRWRICTKDVDTVKMLRHWKGSTESAICFNRNEWYFDIPNKLLKRAKKLLNIEHRKNQSHIESGIEFGKRNLKPFGK